MNEENKIPKFVTDLTNYLIAIRNLSEVYVKNMAITVGQFLEFINIHKFKNKYNSIKDITLNDVRSLTNSDIYSFIYFLAESQYKINSRVVKIEHLRTFFNYLFTIKHTIFTEPFKKINSERKIEKKLPNYLSLDEAKKMIEVYADSIDEIEIRDNAILHLFLNSGLRLAELKNLSIDDLDLKDNKFSIIGKGNKERTGYINDITRKALDEYLKVRDKLNPKTKTLFVSRYGLKMSSTGIEKSLNELMKKQKLMMKIIVFIH
jgi:integrase/recombinase XerD